MKVLSCQGVEFASGSTPILGGLTFDVQAGDLVTIVGPSGSGKTTLLRLLADLISPTKGQLLHKGQPVDELDPIEYRQAVRYVPQAPEMFDGTVRDNLAFVYEIRKLNFDELVVKDVLNQFEMSTSYLDKPVTRLSGGEKQRISLMRSLLFQPEVLLLDEPTSALDKKNLLIVERVLQEFNRQGVTILWVTHNEDQSRRVASRTWRLKAGLLTEAKP